MSSLLTRYQNELIAQLQQQFDIKNKLAMPKIEKIVLNMGIAQANENKEVLTKASEQLATIAGQKPKITQAKQAISSFKLREGDQIGLAVTLRGKKAWNFLEKFTSIVLPRVRDFRGLSTNGFDHAGNYSIGLTEQIIFPEVDYAKIDKIRGLVVTFVIKNSNKQKSQKLLEILGAPFGSN